MKLEDIKEGDIVALQFISDPRHGFITKWTNQVAERYEFAHSLPNTSQKNNVEPVFQETISFYMSKEDQTIDKLRELYNSQEKKPSRTKAIDHQLAYLIKTH